MWKVASGAARETNARTASAPGATTTAIDVAPPSSAAFSTWPIIGSPPTLCSTFGMADFMRVPSPAARMIARQVRFAIVASLVRPVRGIAASFGRGYGRNMVEARARPVAIMPEVRLIRLGRQPIAARPGNVSSSQ